MIDWLLRSLGTRDTMFGRLARRTPFVRLARAAYRRRVLRRGYHNVRLLGVSLRFVVATEREIIRLDDFGSEEKFAQLIVGSIRPGDVCYDIGANIGTVCMLIAGRHRESGVTVHAFEPEPTNADHLQRNLAQNDIHNVVVHQIALGAKPGKATLFLAGDAGSGSHSLMHEHADSDVCIQVQVDTVCNLARDSGTPPDVVKIDVEGAEMNVLIGMDELLSAGRVRDIFIEVHPDTLAGAGLTPDDIQHWLSQRSYRLGWSQARGREIHQHYQRQCEG